MMEISKSTLTDRLSVRRCVFNLIVLVFACSAAGQASTSSASAAANSHRSPVGVAIPDETATPGPTPVVAPNPTPGSPSFPGRLDPTFGTEGRVFVDVVVGLGGSTATACALQSDGKLIIAGSFDRRNSSTSGTHFGLIRLNADGSLDTTFGSGGLATAVFAGIEQATSVALQADGKILVAGQTGNVNDYSADFILVRFNDDGSADTTFGSDGAVVTDFFNSDDTAYDLVVQPDEKIVVAGRAFRVRSSTLRNGSAFGLARYNPDGSLDSAFGTDGKVATDFTGTDDAAFAVALEPGGKILAVGTTFNPAPLYDDFAVARYNSDGSLDSTFDGDGRVTSNAGFGDVAQSVVVQPDGKVVVSGTDNQGSFSSTFVVLRYNTNGSLDTTFGATGIVTTNFGYTRSQSADKLLLQPDGKIVAVGAAYGFIEASSRASEWALARYNPNGSLDPTFGTGGMATVFMGYQRSLAHDAVLQPDGKIVAAGDGAINNTGDAAYASARFLPDNTSPTPTPTPAPNLVFFDATSKTTFERNQFTDNLTVVRTGDTTGPASVDYTSVDGTAQQFADYAFLAGTLNFAPGETSKTIPILRAQDGYAEGDETFTVTLSNPTADLSIGSPDTVTVTILDDDDRFVPPHNAIDDPASFVIQHYHDFLNREPDQSGLQFWTGEITGCGSNPQCREVKRVNVSAAFFLSIEFQETGLYILRTQRAAFGLRSDDAALRYPYESFVHDSRQVSEGVVVGQSGFQQKLEANKQAYAEQVVGSAAFGARYPVSQTATEYVDALYAAAGVTPTSTERQEAIGAFGAGDTPGRVAALRKVSDSDSVRQAEFNTAFVLMQYYGYVRRNPTDPPDTNDDGYRFWLSKLNQFGGNFVRAEMVKAFLDSTEYRGRFGAQ
jgi:uncharacterized delta-60 repeat protein